MRHSPATFTLELSNYNSYFLLLFRVQHFTDTKGTFGGSFIQYSRLHLPLYIMAELDDKEVAPPPPLEATDPDLTDPPLLSEHSYFKTYTTSRFTYPGLRVFYRQHTKAAELPGPLPLLVFQHGLGGSVAQFHALLLSLVNVGPCLALDLPGCGRSKFVVREWEAYTPEALCELIEVVVDDFRDKENDQTVVMIGHSMGSSLSAKVANQYIEKNTLAKHVVGVIGICPPEGPLDENTTTMAKRLLWVPEWIFMAWRVWDAWGGAHSASVSRFVGENAELELKWMQNRYNNQSRTPVWRRMASGLLSNYVDGKPVGGIPGLDVWAGLDDIPIFLVAGENDKLTPPKQMKKIFDKLSKNHSEMDTVPKEPEGIVLTTGTPKPSTTMTKETSGPAADSRNLTVDTTDNDRGTRSELNTPDGNRGGESPPPQPRHPKPYLKWEVLPSPATHALMYQPRSARVLAGLISDFLMQNITMRLSLAWQLSYLSREGKWDVKNLAKWKSVAPVSNLIPSPSQTKHKPVFRAMKTLREADDVHCPEELAKKWGNTIKDVIDLSLDQPVYDPHNLNRVGVHYHKLPTASKIPPTSYTDQFIALVDDIRAQQKERAEKEGWENPEDCVIGVHCHYGFNRTGYLIVCYLVDRCGLELSEAIAEFKAARPNGIRHSHFLDRLCFRYYKEKGFEDKVLE